MAIGIVIEFDGIGQDKYEAVMKELNLQLHSNSNWPEGIISHVAGKTPTGWCVVDVWESEQAFGKFRESKLGPAFGKVTGMPEPKMTMFQLHNKFPV
jgi:quinol monooxygenase YgiN